MRDINPGKHVENLKAAIAGEHYENTEMYPEFAEVATQGLKDIAQRLRSIGKAEVHHEQRYPNSWNKWKQVPL